MRAIILAGGKGTRMKSPLPKVLHKISGRPMVSYIIGSLLSLKEMEKIVAIVGYKRELVKKVLPAGVKAAVQRKMLGTADAVKAAIPAMKGYRGDTLIVCGDTPLITRKTLSALMGSHIGGMNDVTIVTTVLKEPTGYGRIIRSKTGTVTGIVEEKSATPAQKKIKEINSGIYCYDWPKLAYALLRIKKNKLKGEYYLTDAIEIFRKKGFRIGTYTAENPAEVMGVDDLKRLQQAQEYFKRRKNV